MFLPPAERGDTYLEQVYGYSAEYNGYSIRSSDMDGIQGVPTGTKNPLTKFTGRSTDGATHTGGKNGGGAGIAGSSTTGTQVVASGKSSTPVANGTNEMGTSTTPFSKHPTQNSPTTPVADPATVTSHPTDIASQTIPTSDGYPHGRPNSYGSEKYGHHHGLNPAQIAAAVIIPLLALAAIGFLVLFILRRRKRQQTQHHPIETKEIHPDDDFVAAHYASSTPTPQLPPPAPAAVTPTSPPVLLSAVAPGANASYYTGIDTSDQISMHSGPAPSQSNAYAPLGYAAPPPPHGADEPPPPYRPRSAVPSRETSRRQQQAPDDARLSSTQLLAESRENARSPFADPESDDDAMSDISEPTTYAPRGGDDRMSMVSDLSYQDEVIRTGHHPV